VESELDCVDRYSTSTEVHMPDCDPHFPTSLHLCASFAAASDLLVEVDGKVAGLTLVIPS